MKNYDKALVAPVPANFYREVRIAAAQRNLGIASFVRLAVTILMNDSGAKEAQKETAQCDQTLRQL